MKVLMLNYEYPPLGGGAANANRYLLDELKHKDVEIDLVTSAKDEYNQEAISENITLHRLDVNKKEFHHWSQIEILRYLSKGFLKSIQLKRRNDYDVVHAWFGFPSGLMARLLGIPYIVALRGSDVPGYNERFSTQYKLLTPVIKEVWKSAEEVIPNSEGLKDLAQKTLKIDMSVIPNGIKLEDFQPEYDRESKVLRLLCVSRLTERKRVSDIIKSIKNVDNVELTVIGSGQKEDELKDLAKSLDLENKVQFTGRLPHEDLPQWYSEADVFVLPSLNEGMSNTVLEAMASGLPVITTDTGGTEELIKGNGVIVPKKDPDSIRSEIIEYRESREKLIEQGKRSRNMAEEMSWEKVADSYYEVYREIE